ncbi:MAG: putative endonuclease [Gammaproteobacteria bacterium]|jgi:putative endonuclease|nr:putative endonuclease [Gammaproteobacteria bacterium]
MAKTAVQTIGQQAETWALRYLQERGLELIERNFYCPNGEIDLILRDKEDLVFAEVRYRQQKSHGTGVETVNGAKQRKILRSAEYYLYSKKLWDHPCRFDVIGVSMDAEQQVAIVWEKNAFDGNYYT